MADLDGFWSYVRADDETDGERVSRLARDVVSQYEMQTGETIALFLDRDAIEWGQRWRDMINEALASVAFFIPILTPRYFTSAECRRELQSFARKAIDLGVKDLVLPLLYVNHGPLHEENPEDDLVALVKQFHWQDWRELRFAEVSSEVYRRGVSDLAARLVEANANADRAGMTVASLKAEAAADEGADDTPGVLDRLAGMEEAYPEWQATLESIGQDIQLIGQIMEQATADMEKGDKQGKGFAARLVVTRRVARKLSEPAERLRSSGNDFASQMHDVDEGTRILIALAPEQVAENAEARSEVCDLFHALRELSATAHESLGSVQFMVDEISSLEGMSRDLRPPLRRLKQGLTLMLEAREVTDEWVRLMDETGIDCDDESAPVSDG